MPLFFQMVEDAKPATGSKINAKQKDPFLPERPQAQAPTQGAASFGKGRKILVVDDNAFVLKAFEMRLKSDGFNVSALGNPEAVASTVEQGQIELILLDIDFPPSGAMEWNGFTVMQWLRRFPKLAGIPVILVSGSGPALYKEKALQAGAGAFFEN